MSALANQPFKQVRSNPELWGRWIESAIGVHLINSAIEHGFELFYWRERSREVDFVVCYQGRLLAIEVKSHKRQTALPGMDAFVKAFKPNKVLLVGGDVFVYGCEAMVTVKVWRIIQRLRVLGI